MYKYYLLYIYKQYISNNYSSNICLDVNSSIGIILYYNEEGIFVNSLSSNTTLSKLEIKILNECICKETDTKISNEITCGKICKHSGKIIIGRYNEKPILEIYHLNGNQYLYYPFSDLLTKNDKINSISTIYNDQFIILQFNHSISFFMCYIFYIFLNLNLHQNIQFI